MKVEQMKNKDGKPMETTKGEPMMEYKLEKGDEFILTLNSVIEKKNDSKVDGKMKTITNYSVKATVRDKDKKPIEDGKEIFITLTPTQAKALNKRKDNGMVLTQHLFTAYEYKNEYGDNVGVGTKDDLIPPKTFEEFDKE